MAYQQFIVSDHNPNDTHGGGGCVCDPSKQVDCKPPYIVAYGNEMDSAVSPHVVICQNCVSRMRDLLGGEALSAGEDNVVRDSAAPEPSAQEDAPEFDIDKNQFIKRENPASDKRHGRPRGNAAPSI